MSENVSELIRKISLDRMLPDPLHHQLSLGIQSLVAEGRLRPGDRMPNVADISRICGVSKGTAMQGIAELRRRQILIAKRRSGIHVAPVIQKSTEVVFCSGSNPVANKLGDFLEQLIEGLKTGYADPHQRFMATMMNDNHLSAQGILSAAEARGVDSMVFYRPVPGIFSVVAEVARRLPCVTLVRPIPNSRADCVAFALAPPVKRLLRSYLARGVRSFAYVGQLALITKETDGPYAPYAAIYEAALEALAEAGIELTVCLAPERYPESLPTIETEARLLQRARGLPDHSVVLAQTGTLADKLARLGKEFKVITYTEYHMTLNACRDKATVLYGGLELLGKAAARVLKERVGNPSRQKPEPAVLIEPQVVA